MNKEQAKERLCAIETEVEKLRRIIDEPEQREPEAGDVWSKGGNDYLLSDDGYEVIGSSTGKVKMVIEPSPWLTCGYTRLGKFDEVYVKISDVREAVISYYHQGSTVMSTDALCKLNIITD